MTPKSAGNAGPQSNLLASAERRQQPGDKLIKEEGLSIGSAEFSTVPTTEKSAPFLAA
jgi:hypothetical protein